MRFIGRLAFPIYAYLIAEGCRHTRNKKKYLGLIAVMALVFQIVYLVFMRSLYQGILVTFSLAIGLIYSIDMLINSEKTFKKALAISTIAIILFIGIACPIIFKEYGFEIDYKIWGLTLPVLIYFTPNKRWRIIFLFFFLVTMSIFSKPLQWWSLVSVPLLALYNGTRGKRKMKYFFYILYPLHLVIIYGIMILLMLLKSR